MSKLWLLEWLLGGWHLLAVADFGHGCTQHGGDESAESSNQLGNPRIIKVGKAL